MFHVLKIFEFFCLSAFVLVVFCNLCVAKDRHVFEVGEEIDYEIRWSFIPAARATFKVLPNKNINNELASHFVMTAKSLPIIDVFYKVRDRIDSFTDVSVGKTLLYLKKQQEGSTNRDIEVLFNWPEKQAVYSNHGEKLNPIKIQEGTLDPLSAFYFMRNQQLNIKSNLSRYITDGKKNILGNVKVLGRQKLKVKAGQFDTIKIEPDMQDVRGVFEKSNNAKLHIWLTDDDRHIMVKAKSKVVVGSFILEMVDYKPGGKDLNGVDKVPIKQ